MNSEQRLVASGRSSGLNARGAAVMFGAGARESLLDTRLDIAFRLPTDSSQL